MFSNVHIIWLAICLLLICITVLYVKKNNVSLEKILNAACVICIISELIKIFSMMELVPSSDGTMMYPYMMPQHLPFHLCSIQILVIFYIRLGNEGKLKDALMAFIYPTGIIGAALALMMPSIFTGGTIELSQAFTHPLAYQYFLYHTMLMILGISIVLTKQVDIRRQHYFSTLGILGVLGILSIYLNSALAAPTYANGELVTVDYTPNFFFTVKLPFDIVYTDISQWYLYIGFVVIVAVIVIGLFYIPFFKKK